VALGQTPSGPNTTYKLLSVHVKGLQRLTEEQVVAASGLKIGRLTGEAGFQQAAQKLGQTGVFTEMNYTFQYSRAGCDLEFQVTENPTVVPTVFDNLVWFSDKELVDLLRARVPLFDGKVPEQGNLAEQVSQALASILKEKNIQGEITYFPFARDDGPIESYDYKLTFHSVVIRNVDFPGAAADEVPALTAAAKPLAGTNYLLTDMRMREKLDLLPVFRARGYLKAQFADAQTKVVQEGAQTLVDVSFPVVPGSQYRVSEVQIVGEKAFSVENLRDLLHLKIGEPANAVQLSEDLQQIHKLYGTKGYLMAHVDPAPQMDDGKATVSYQLNVQEGDVYRMGDLSIDGLPDENAKRMAAQWQMKKGDAYDESYLQRFFSILYRDFGLNRTYDLDPKQAIDRNEKTVSVSLHFVPH
jgi:outer membrane protein insertion porin family